MLIFACILGTSFVIAAGARAYAIEQRLQWINERKAFARSIWGIEA